MRPPLRSRRAVSRIVLIEPLRLMAIWLSMRASSPSAMVASLMMPALLTRTSTPPNAVSAASHIRATALGSLTLAWTVSELNHLVGAQQDRLRDGEVESLGRLEIKDHLVLGGRLDGKFVRFRAAQYAIDISRRLTKLLAGSLLVGGPCGAVKSSAGSPSPRSEVGREIQLRVQVDGSHVDARTDTVSQAAVAARPAMYGPSGPSCNWSAACATWRERLAVKQALAFIHRSC
jgi:hypothetical protein